MPVEKLIFVYNANSGKVNALLDSAHKIVSPSTYQCRLCELTYGTLKENKEWVRFRESLVNEKFMPCSTRYESVISNYLVKELDFLHKNEFEKQYRSKWLPKYDYPVILEVTSNGLELFMSDKELQQLPTTDRLIQAITTKLNAQ
ncbi:hypothetical protein [Nonlabens marinus]|uniref:GTPase n=1 Tax=Nonlabens marinus S1-08 TaxID=1454201 RepID=W8VZK6_9FLAO|nr:hypothetical protein [Nonlabens marinus]BAO54741.1 hypothetical protein NMS_0732 [Nonlabens marinus S1-08]